MIVKKDYLFYGAFGVGIVALVAVLAAYNLNSKKSTKDQSIDLNASGQEIMQEADNVDVLGEDNVLAQDEQGEMDDSKQTEQADAAIQPAPDMDAPDDSIAEEQTEEPPADETLSDGDAQEEKPENETNEQASASEEEQENTAKTVESLNAYNGAQTLTWPVTGDIILPYSMDTTVYFRTLEQYKCNPGMLIASEHGDQVASVYAGTIKEIGKSNEYGDYLVMDLGNGYEVFYGQLEDIHVSENDQVGAGDKLASIAEPSSYFEKEGSHLYIAITKDDKPINPVSLMAD